MGRRTAGLLELVRTSFDTRPAADSARADDGRGVVVRVLQALLQAVLQGLLHWARADDGRGVVVRVAPMAAGTVVDC